MFYRVPTDDERRARLAQLDRWQAMLDPSKDHDLDLLVKISEEQAILVRKLRARGRW